MKQSDATIAKRGCSDRRDRSDARAGRELTLITRQVHTCYSDMLQGMIAGHYTADEAHIGLLLICPG